ncbi:rod shape-determining protein MreC [Candidatus Babeliales bacterium]|nr:rod shape-determining protein MreC [Candidatus Babeliales bacterium]MBP9843534.1 rod shape-determining protein MreC [Candidatus Babeliales bacterium]
MEQVGLKDWLIRLFFLFLFAFMINRLFFFSPGVAEVTTSYLLYPLIKVQKVFTDPIHAHFTKKSDIALLQNDVALLQERNEELQAKIIALESIVDFQVRSEEVRNFEQKYDFSQQKIAQVLMRSFDDVGHFYWVDAGSKQGICVNMIAIYKNNIVGRVIYVDPFYSKIALVTDKRCKIAVSCVRTKTVGIYEGDNNFFGKLEFVPHYQILQQDDLLMSTGQGLVYPQGFAVGSIKNFEVQDVAYKVAVEPLVDLQKIEFIYLVSIAEKIV